MDETLGLPTEQAVTVALRTQQILAHETGVTRVADPLGGAWFIEELTDRMETEALEFIAEIDGMGRSGQAPGAPEAAKSPAAATAPVSSYGRGVVEGINRGYFRRKIAEASYRFAEECEAGDRIIVGVNEYMDPGEKRSIDILTIPDSVETEQVDRLTRFKAGRDAGAVEAALERIRATCRDGDPGSQGAAGYPASAAALGLHPTNVMPALIHAALCGCTLGEMTQAIADVCGRYGGGPEW
jgi:methylmalonyl-CoA mutase N-terminal domain/subunit